MKTIKIYEKQDLKTFNANVPFHADAYGKFGITPKNAIPEFYLEKMDDDTSTKVRFSEALSKTNDSDLLELNNSFHEGLSKTEQEIKKLEQDVKDKRKSISHYKKQQARIKDAKTFVEAFEILMKTA